MVNVFEDEKKLNGPLEELDLALSGAIREILGRKEIVGKLNESLLMHTFGRISSPRVLLVGAGKRRNYCSDQLRMVAGTATRVLRKRNIRKLAFFIEDKIDPSEKSQTIAEGVTLALFEPDTHRTKKEEDKKEVEEVIVGVREGVKEEKIKTALEKGQIIGESVNWSRYLINEPANWATPSRMVEEARKVAQQGELEIEVIDESEAIKRGMGAFAGIAKGSEEPSFMVSLKYFGAGKEKPPIGLVGKGLTFDSGGISLKKDEKMHEMKYDMAGAAAVLGVFKAIGQLKPKINLVGLLPLTENLPSGKAIKPGDVVTALNGKTIEITNTDAEGRVVLADALVYAQEMGAKKLVDLATLTGAVIVALGRGYTGLFGRPQSWVDQLQYAARMTGEKMWQLPVPSEYKEAMRSDVADLDNIGSSGREGGAIKGALFLEEFVEEGVEWVHLDIAGTAWTDGESPYLSKGPTGVGVRTLVRLISDLEAQDGQSQKRKE